MVVVPGLGEVLLAVVVREKVGSEVFLHFLLAAAVAVAVAAAVAAAAVAAAAVVAAAAHLCRSFQRRQLPEELQLPGEQCLLFQQWWLSAELRPLLPLV